VPRHSHNLVCVGGHRDCFRIAGIRTERQEPSLRQLESHRSSQHVPAVRFPAHFASRSAYVLHLLTQ
jgi:hypothetical protein